MITQQEWDELKANEQYGMYARIDRKVSMLSEQITDLRNDFNNLVKMLERHFKVGK